MSIKIIKCTPELKTKLLVEASGSLDIADTVANAIKALSLDNGFKSAVTKIADSLAQVKNIANNRYSEARVSLKRAKRHRSRENQTEKSNKLAQSLENLQEAQAQVDVLVKELSDIESKKYTMIRDFEKLPALAQGFAGKVKELEGLIKRAEGNFKTAINLQNLDEVLDKLLSYKGTEQETSAILTLFASTERSVSVVKKWVDTFNAEISEMFKTLDTVLDSIEAISSQAAALKAQRATGASDAAWDEKYKKLLANTAELDRNEATAALNKFWDDYYQQVWFKSYGDKVGKQVKQLGSTLEQELSQLGFSSHTNPFVVFIKNWIALKNELPFDYKAYGAIHNAYCRSIITSAQLTAKLNPSNNILYSEKLYTIPAVDILELLALSKTVKQTAISQLTAAVAARYNDNAQAFYVDFFYVGRDIFDSDTPVPNNVELTDSTIKPLTELIQDWSVCNEARTDAASTSRANDDTVASATSAVTNTLTKGSRKEIKTLLRTVADGLQKNSDSYSKEDLAEFKQALSKVLNNMMP